MKKFFTLITAALLFTNAFAHGGKDCGKEKACCKKDGAKKECHKSDKSSHAKTTKATKSLAKKA